MWVDDLQEGHKLIGPNKKDYVVLGVCGQVVFIASDNMLDAPQDYSSYSKEYLKQRKDWQLRKNLN